MQGTPALELGFRTLAWLAAAGFGLAALLTWALPAAWTDRVLGFIKRLEDSRLKWWLAAVFGVVVCVYYAASHIFRYQSFGLSTYDFGIFVQVAWKAAYHQPPDLAFNHQPSWLGDHFQPIMYLFAPFVWIFSAPTSLLVAEPLAIALSFMPLARLAWKHTRSTPFTLSLLGAYAFAYSTFYALDYPFHPSSLVGPLLIWLFWAAEEARWWQYGVALLLALMCKEDVGFYTGMFGLWMLIFDRRPQYRWIGLSTAAFSFGWSYLALNVLIPHFKHQAFKSIYDLDPSLKAVNHSAAQTFLHDPARYWQVATDTSDKVNGWLGSLLTFGGLPALFAWFLPVIPMYAERFLSSNPNHYAVVFHYGAPTIAALAYMAVRAASGLLELIRKGLERWKKRGFEAFSYLAFMALAGLMLYGTQQTDRALGVHTYDLTQLRAQAHSAASRHRQQAVAMIPAKASVYAQDGFATHLSERNPVALLDGHAPDPYQYVIVDPTMPDWPLGPTGVQDIYLKSMVGNPKWDLVYHEDSVYLFKQVQ